MQVVVFGCLGLVIVLAAVPQLGLGLSLQGILGAVMILLFGFLFVTVSSRLTGEVKRSGSGAGLGPGSGKGDFSEATTLSIRAVAPS